jgi:hypothetical protein
MQGRLSGAGASSPATTRRGDARNAAKHGPVNHRRRRQSDEMGYATRLSGAACRAIASLILGGPAPSRKTPKGGSDDWQRARRVGGHGHALRDYLDGKGRGYDSTERDDGWADVSGGRDIYLADYQHWPLAAQRTRAVP